MSDDKNISRLQFYTNWLFIVCVLQMFYGGMDYFIEMHIFLFYPRYYAFVKYVSYIWNLE